MAKKQSTASLRKEVARLTAALHELNKQYQFKHKPGRPILVVQVGDAATGCAPTTAGLATG